MIEKLTKTEVPEKFIGNTSIGVQRLISDNQKTITDFIEKDKSLSIQYTDKKNGGDKATELAVAIFKIIFHNEIPLKTRLLYQFTPTLVNLIQDRQPLYHVVNADIVIFDKFDYIDGFNGKIISSIIGQRHYSNLKSIYISNEKLSEISKRNVILQGIINNYLEIAL